MFDKTVETTSKRNPSENLVIQEMIKTEQTYNEALKLLELALHMEVLVESNPLLLEIKEQITILKSISDELLSNVTDGINPDISVESRTNLRLQRTQLLKAFFQAYPSFAVIYNKYVIANTSDSRQFEKIDAYLHIHNNALGLNAHLIMPVQRGPRYQMLVATTIKNAAHLDAQNLAELTELNEFISETLIQINTLLTPPKASARSYWPGKITYELIWGSSAQAAEPATSKEPEPLKPGYRLGDYTRSFLRTFSGRAEEPYALQPSAVVPSSDENHLVNTETEEPDTDGFEVILSSSQ